MIATIVIARLLTPSDFGVVTLATGALLLLRAALGLPVAAALVQMKRVTRKDYETAFTLSVARGTLVSVLLVLAAWPVAQIYDDGRLFELFLVISISPFIAGFESPTMTKFVRDVNYVPQTVIETVAKLISFTVAIAVAYIYETYWALVIALVAPEALMVPLTYLAAPFRWRLSLAKVKEIFSFAGWMSLSGFVSNFNEGGDRFIIGAIVNNAAVGFFSMGRTMASSVSWVVGVPLMRAMFPAFSRIREDESRLRAAYLKAQGMSLFALVPLGMGLALVALPATVVLIGEQWLPAVPVVQWLAPFSAIFAAFYMPTQACILAVGQPRKFVHREVIVFIVGVPSVILGVYFAGLMGAVYARCAVGTLQLALNFQMLRKTVGVGVMAQAKNSARTLISIAAMALVVVPVTGMLDTTSLAPSLQLVCSILAGALAYGACHFALWLIQGKPEGPETLLIGLLEQLLSKIAPGHVAFGAASK